MELWRVLEIFSPISWDWFLLLLEGRNAIWSFGADTPTINICHQNIFKSAAVIKTGINILNTEEMTLKSRDISEPRIEEHFESEQDWQRKKNKLDRVVMKFSFIQTWIGNDIYYLATIQWTLLRNIEKKIFAFVSIGWSKIYVMTHKASATQQQSMHGSEQRLFLEISIFRLENRAQISTAQAHVASSSLMFCFKYTVEICFACSLTALYLVASYI